MRNNKVVHLHSSIVKVIIQSKIAIGERFGEKYPSFVRNGANSYLFKYLVTGFHTDSSGNVFADTLREDDGGHVGIAIDLLTDNIFYDKLDN